MSNTNIPIDLHIRASLQIELTEASKDPTLRPLLKKGGAALLPRYSHYYAHLTHLPRRTRRAMQRQWQRSLSALALLLALGQAPFALAATIPVNGSSCTLINAITAANTDSAVGGCQAGRGSDTLVLGTNSIHTLTKVNNVGFYDGRDPFSDPSDANNGLPIINSTITIEGRGSTIRRSADAPRFRILTVGFRGNLTLKETTVSGSASLDSGIVNVRVLTLINSTVLGNNRGIENFDEYGTLTLRNSTVSGNQTGISNNYSTVTLINSVVSNNEWGGVVDIFEGGGNISMSNSTVSGNGYTGVACLYGDLSITNSTISGNGGFGVFGYWCDANLTHITVSGNKDTGLFFDDYSILAMNHSLISGNSNREVINLSYGDPTSNFNLFGHNGLTNDQAFVGFTPGPTDITSTSNGTRPKALNRILNPVLTRSGGATPTHNLVPSSPAVNAVVTGCPPPATDQRGVPRPQNAACDIGAVELVFCNGQAATLVGTAANNTLTGTSRNDVIHGMGGNDRIFGMGGNDSLCGGTGNDALNGGTGIDVCNGASGTDTAVNCETRVSVP